MFSLFFVKPQSFTKNIKNHKIPALYYMPIFRIYSVCVLHRRRMRTQFVSGGNYLQISYKPKSLSINRSDDIVQLSEPDRLSRRPVSGGKNCGRAEGYEKNKG